MFTENELREALNACDWNKTRAAEKLGCHRGTIRKLCRIYQIRPTAKDPVVRQAEQAEIGELRRQTRDLSLELAKHRELNSLISELSKKRPAIPEWMKPSRSDTQDRAIITAILSDTHFDEIVHPEQINYVNAYNRAIAQARLKRFFENTLLLSTEYINGIKIDGLVLPLLGDILSGNIHEELRRTNEATVLEGVLFWSTEISAGIKLLLERFPQIFIPCVVGNHGRLDQKPVAKFRAQENFDWLLSHLIARNFEGVKEVQFCVSESSDTRWEVYGTRYQATHGDQFRGGSGIAGMLSPLMIGDHRKRKREMATNTPYDYLVMGHWHQLAHFKNIIVNGSLKGYDEWASQMNFDFEPPQQAFWLTDPKWGITIKAPVHVLGGDEEWQSFECDVVRVA